MGTTKSLDYPILSHQLSQVGSVPQTMENYPPLLTDSESEDSDDETGNTSDYGSMLGDGFMVEDGSDSEDEMPKLCEEESSGGAESEFAMHGWNPPGGRFLSSTVDFFLIWFAWRSCDGRRNQG